MSLLAQRVWPRRLSVAFGLVWALAVGLGCESTAPAGGQRSSVHAQRFAQRKQKQKAPEPAPEPAPAPKAPPVPKLDPVQEKWSARAAQACEVEIEIVQGDKQGRLGGRIASTLEGQVMAALDGELGDAPCRVRARTLADAFLVESFSPKLGYAVTHKTPLQEAITWSQKMRLLASPMALPLLAQGCAEQLQLPPPSSSWAPNQHQAQEIRWSGPGGATQTLHLDPSSGQPTQRMLRFQTQGGQSSQWTVKLRCQGG